MIAAAAMSLSSVCVVSNALRLRAWKPKALPALSKALPDGAQEQGSDFQDAKIKIVNIFCETDNAHEKLSIDKKEKDVEKKFSVEGMMCEHCVAHVKSALEKVEGVSDVVVSLEGGTACVKLMHDVSTDVLISAIQEEGYEAQEL